MANADSSLHPWLHLWFSRVGDQTLAAEQGVRACLSVAETERWQAIKSARKSREYLLSRALMRHALSREFGHAEAHWQFDEQGGAPLPTTRLPRGVHLSLSHSGGYVCFALANSAVGVDIELVRRRRKLAGAARMFMNAAELERFAASEARQMEYFFRCWCAKEACYKALAPDAQATRSLGSIAYEELLAGSAGMHLLEAAGSQFRFAAVTDRPPRRVEQHHFIVPLSVELDRGR